MPAKITSLQKIYSQGKLTQVILKFDNNLENSVAGTLFLSSGAGNTEHGFATPAIPGKEITIPISDAPAELNDPFLHLSARIKDFTDIYTEPYTALMASGKMEVIGGEIDGEYNSYDKTVKGKTSTPITLDKITDASLKDTLTTIGLNQAQISFSCDICYDEAKGYKQLYLDVNNEGSGGLLNGMIKFKQVSLGYVSATDKAVFENRVTGLKQQMLKQLPAAKEQE
jgi:hypothetical protein